MLWAYIKSELILLSRKKAYLILSIMLPLVLFNFHSYVRFTKGI